MAGHTKGPWVVDSVGVSVQHTLPRGKGTRRICRTSSTAGVRNLPIDAENAANATLIAAAPDLLEALEDLVVQVGDSHTMRHEIDTARAAIAKARGMEGNND